MKKPLKPVKKPRNRAAQDATLVNNRSTGKRLAALEAAVQEIQRRIGTEPMIEKP